MLILKIAKYIGFFMYRRPYQVFNMVPRNSSEDLTSSREFSSSLETMIFSACCAASTSATPLRAASQTQAAAQPTAAATAQGQTNYVNLESAKQGVLLAAHAKKIVAIPYTLLFSPLPPSPPILPAPVLQRTTVCYKVHPAKPRSTPLA